MNMLGWMLMGISWLAILSLASFCIWKILTVKKGNIHAPLDIDTGETPGPRAAGK